MTTLIELIKKDSEVLKLKQKIKNVRTSFDGFFCALPEADYFKCLADGYDWDNVMSELEKLCGEIHALDEYVPKENK